MLWFRMWADAVDDEKLRLLAFEDRWHFVALLCLKAQGVLEEKNKLLRRRKIGVKLGLDSVELETAMKRLVTAGLVSSGWEPLGWKKRQFVSDSSTQRVQKHRQRLRNVSVTPSDTETDTDSEVGRTTSSPSIKTIGSLNSSRAESDLKIGDPEKNRAHLRSLSQSLAQQKKVLR